MSYKTRNQYTISTVGNSKDREDHWLSDLQKELLKQAVQPRHVDQSMYDQINGIIGGSSSKFKSVSDAVEDMQRRSGYLDYLNKKVSSDDSSSKEKTGDKKESSKPKLFLKNPQIEVTINNYCSHTKGEQAIPAVLNHVRGIHDSDVIEKSLWDEQDLINYIHKMNESCKVDHGDDLNVNLGKAMAIFFDICKVTCQIQKIFF